MGAADAGPPTAAVGTPPARRPRSKIPAVIFWFIVAAVVFRVGMIVLARGDKIEPVGLVRWQPLERASAAAANDGKPVLYDFTAAWCGPCRRLDEEGWGDSGIADLVNASYVPVRVVDREREDGKNPEPIEDLERRYEVTAFPTLIVASSDGRLLGRVEGYGGRERLRRFLGESRGR